MSDPATDPASDPGDQLSVLLVAEDVLDREPMAKLVPSGHPLTIVHAEVEAAALTYAKAEPDVVFLAINNLDSSADFLKALLQKCNVTADASPFTVALCISRHSPRAGELCVEGLFDDFATAKPTPHTERVHLALHRAKMVLAMRRELTESRARVNAARAGFETLAALQRDWIRNAEKIKAQPPNDKGPALAALLDDVNERVARIAVHGQSACRGGTKKVLVVDDDELMREILGASLESGGYETCFAGSAEEAIKLLARDRVALILMDLMMPGLDGIGATREIRALPNYRSVPIVVVSGKGSLDSIKKSRAVGATDFVVKPVDQDRLLEKVGKYLQ